MLPTNRTYQMTLAAISLLVIIAGCPRATRAQGTIILDALGLTTLINPSCADFKVLGPCSCTGLGLDQLCQVVAYHVPKYLVETVLIPGDTLIGPGLLPPAIGGALPALLNPLGVSGAGGAGNAISSGHTALHFREVHVYAFPDITFFGCRACDLATLPGLPLLIPHYFSELDTAAWRFVSDGLVIGLPFNIGGVGVWGSLYPRTGFNRHHELPVAAALASYRAVHVVHHPLPDLTSPVPHVVVLPGAGTVPQCFQVGYPQLSRCARPGMNPIHWDLEKIGPHGRNIFIYWERKQCCVDPVLATCGLTLSAGNVDNFCDIPLIPSTGIVPGMPPDIPFDGK
jgi:hypothetical protein